MTTLYQQLKARLFPELSEAEKKRQELKKKFELDLAEKEAKQMAEIESDARIDAVKDFRYKQEYNRIARTYKPDVDTSVQGKSTGFGFKSILEQLGNLGQNAQKVVNKNLTNKQTGNDNKTDDINARLEKKLKEL